MARRERYSDKITGKADQSIRSLIECKSSENSILRLKKLLLNIINNELTARQKEIIMLYYFKGIDTVTIARESGVSPQSVSAVLSRARKRLYRIMKYYF